MEPASEPLSHLDELSVADLKEMLQEQHAQLVAQTGKHQLVFVVGRLAPENPPGDSLSSRGTSEERAGGEESFTLPIIVVRSGFAIEGFQTPLSLTLSPRCAAERGSLAHRCWHFAS